ncbi:MAG: hypothetical protein H7834_03430 [Magnetococcus sp. YQC-9]
MRRNHGAAIVGGGVTGPYIQGELARLFVALNPPEALKEQLTELANRISPLPPGWHWQAPEMLHLTARFFGDVPVDEIPALQEQLATIAPRHTPMRLQLTGWGAFPSASRARDLAILPPPAAPRPFKPHLTLARCRVESNLEKLLPTLPAFSSDWEVTDVALMRSYLETGNATHKQLF